MSEALLLLLSLVTRPVYEPNPAPVTDVYFKEGWTVERVGPVRVATLITRRGERRMMLGEETRGGVLLHIYYSDNTESAYNYAQTLKMHEFPKEYQKDFSP